MTKLTKQEWNRMTQVPPNPIWTAMWTFVGTILAIMFFVIIGLGLVWLIKLLIGAIF